MKKVLSLTLALIMLLTTFPVYAMAAETGPSDDTDLIALACEVFPEYATLIQQSSRSNAATYSSRSSRDIVFSETRAVNENEQLMITQFSSGEVVIVDQVTVSATLEKTDSYASYVGTDIIGYASFDVESTFYSGTFSLNNVGFIISQSGSGTFRNHGTVSIDGGVSFTKDSKSSNSYIHYDLSFASAVGFDFELYFTNGQLHASVW